MIIVSLYQLLDTQIIPYEQRISSNKAEQQNET